MYISKDRFKSAHLPLNLSHRVLNSPEAVLINSYLL
nr:MAG TPA: hypothetical protein [Herelleviridae sp.]